MSASSSTQDKGVIQPGQVIRPIVTVKEIPALVKKVFGLTAVSVRELNSYDDKNFYVQVKSRADNPYIGEVCPSGYVVKILNSMDTKDEKLVDAQNQIMLFLHSRGFNVPKPVMNVDGALMRAEKIAPQSDDIIQDNAARPPTSEHMVRLLTFLEGTTLYHVPYTAQLAYECGAYLASVDNVLKDWHNETLKTRRLIWMLECVPELSRFTFVLKDQKQKTLIEDVLQAWKMNVVPVIPQLEKGIIHGDFNEQNIIVRADPHHPDTYHVDGLLDFGDSQYSCFIFELAILVAYLMIEVKSIPLLDVGGHAVAGYLTKRNLPHTEWQVLKECVGARLTQSLVLGAYSYEQDPGNEYLLTTAAKGWRVLANFWNTPKEEVLDHWKKICKTCV